MHKKEGKNIAKAHAAVEKRPYILQDAVPLLQKVKFAKFDETVEVTLRLGVDPKHADQMVRGPVVLPHCPVGKISFTPEKLIDNATVLITSVIKAKPSVAKGKYIKGCTLSSTMGPGILLDVTPIETAAKA